MEEKYLYLILYPNQSLIASQLDPSRFAQHYANGSTGFFGGNFLFADIDPDFRNDYFRIDAVYSQMTTHEDGRPRATKFVCNYRTLEHIDLNAIRSLYYCNAHGKYIELKAGEFRPTTTMTSANDTRTQNTEQRTQNTDLSIYLDIGPTKMIVLSRQEFIEYGKFSIDPDSFVSSPAILYTQVGFDIDDFLMQFEHNPFLPLKLPNIHPARLRDHIHEVQSAPAKKNKGLSMDCPFDKISYRSLRRGFMFMNQTQTKFFPLIPMNIVEKDFYQFWKSM